MAPALPTLPTLPALDRAERRALDYQLLGMSARLHPMSLRRRDLRRRGVYTIAELRDVPEGRIVRVAGWAISAQRPPQLAAQLHHLLRDARVVVVMGRVERVRWYRSLLGADIHAAG